VSVIAPNKVINHASGMVRSSDEGKTDYTLIMDGVMFERWAQHLTNGVKAGYEPRNWVRSIGNDLDGSIRNRAKASAFRHMIQWLNGSDTEDHAAAIIFNINLYESIGQEECQL